MPLMSLGPHIKRQRIIYHLIPESIFIIKVISISGTRGSSELTIMAIIHFNLQ
jgi:hypothetical protein